MIICKVLFTSFRFFGLYSLYFPNYLNIGTFIPNMKQVVQKYGNRMVEISIHIINVFNFYT